ncbi:hypothetical protein ACVW00_000055 [Marmoricola sp. URHA0025 HA25]
MGIGTRIYRLGAVLPGIVLSAAFLLVVSACLPATLGGMLLVAYVVGAVMLACGAFEAPAVRVLGRSRRATMGDEQLLRGLAGWLDGRAVAVPDLYVARGDMGRAAAEPCGQHSVVVAPRLLGWLHRQQVSQAVVAAVVAQAAAGLSVGPSRFDLAVRLLTAPGALVVAGFVRVARWFTWVPGVLGLWRIRAVFGIVAVWQCLQAHQLTIAVTTGTLIAVSYTGPACARAWRRRVEAAADRWVARAGLGDQLEFAVRSACEPGSFDRVERIRGFAKAQSADLTTRVQRELYLVR